ncbi:MAG: hypothetical protein AABZ53_01875 [Planctomycetota bacterium]
MTIQPTTHQDLASYALGEASPDAAAKVEQSLTASPELRAGLARIKDALGMLSRAELHEPPSALVQSALRLVGPRTQSPTWLERAADAIAKLVFDSVATPGLAGFRSSATLDARHMTFDCEGGEIDLEILAPNVGSGVHRVTGQIAISGELLPSSVGYVLHGSGNARTSTIDERGRFTLELTGGRWDLRFVVQVGDQERVIALPQLEIG